MSASIWSLVASTALFMASWGCSSDAGDRCGAVGKTQACVCSGGASGAQSCTASGAWTMCQCVGTPTDTAGGDTGPEDTAPGPDTSAPTCDHNGFELAPRDDNTGVYELDDGGFGQLYVGFRDDSEETSTSIMIFLPPSLNGVFALTEGPSDQGVYVLIREGCSGPPGNCQRRYLAMSGTLEVSSSGVEGAPYTGRLTNVKLIEVTVEEGGNVAAVEGGQTWCIDTLDFQGRVAPGGCTDERAANFSEAAQYDDGSCTYPVTFTVAQLPINPGSVVYVSGDFQVKLGHEAWCGTCTPMAEAGTYTWSATVALPPGSYQYKFHVDDWASSETVPEECGVRSGNFVNRAFEVVDAPVEVPGNKFGQCPCDPAVCNGLDACRDYECRSLFEGTYSPGAYEIVTQRGTCRNKMGVSIANNGALRIFGVDPSTGEPSLAFSEVSCQTGFQGSSLQMKVQVFNNGATLLTPPNNFRHPVRLVFSHANITDEIAGDLVGTFRQGRYSATLAGLPDTVSIGLDNQVTAATFATDEVFFDAGVLNAADYVGTYERRPVDNDFHVVEIVLENGQLRWRNAAGVSWSLARVGGTLRTGPDCPYGEIDMVVEPRRAGNGQIVPAVRALHFNNDAYWRL